MTADLPSVSGYVDPEGDVPWAMQVVVRYERSTPPAASAAIEAVAMAVVRLLASDQAAPGGSWHEQVARWTAGRIRKLVRHARGAKWDAAQEVPGLTVEHRGAEARAIVPGPIDQVPRQIARLQLQGLALDDVGPAPNPPGDAVVVALTPLVALSTGKAAAQAAHAAQLAWRDMPGSRRDQWTATGCAVGVVRPHRDEWERLRTMAPVVIRDAGFTEIAPGTTTAAAMW